MKIGILVLIGICLVTLVAFNYEIRAFLFKGRVVYLEAFDGEVTESVAYTNQFGHMIAAIQPFGMRTCILLDDGTIQNEIVSYVKRWKYKYN